MSAHTRAGVRVLCNTGLAAFRGEDRVREVLAPTGESFARPLCTSDAADDAAEAVGGQAAGASSRPGIPEAFPAYPVPGSAHGHGAGAAAAASAGAAGAAGAAAGSSAAPAPAAPAPAPAAPQAQPQPSAIVPPSRRPVVNAARRPWLEIDQERYPLVGALTVIGRDALADIVLDDPGISRRHSEVRVTNDGPHLVTSIRDLGSTNGTFVNGERITSVRLQDGDRLTVGRTAVVLSLIHISEPTRPY